MKRARSILLTLLCGGVLLTAMTVTAQDIYRFNRTRRYSRPIRTGLPQIRDGFTFVRLWYTDVRNSGSGNGWSTDYPNGDHNLLVRLPQISSFHASRWSDGEPGYAALRATDPLIFQNPFLYASDVGTISFTNREAASLREYLLKGGFFWVDDYWGTWDWAQWEREIRRVLPGFPIQDIPSDHPILTNIFTIHKVPQIPSIQLWRRNGGRTSERGADSEVVHFRGIFDEAGHLMVLMTHNTDIADGWEREGDSEEFFRLFSPDSYRLALNIVFWAMTR